MSLDDAARVIGLCSVGLYRAGVQPNMATALTIAKCAVVDAWTAKIGRDEFMSYVRFVYEVRKELAGSASFSIPPHDPILTQAECAQLDRVVASVLYDPRIPELPSAGLLYVQLALVSDVLWGVYAVPKASAWDLMGRVYDRQLQAQVSEHRWQGSADVLELLGQAANEAP